MTKERMPDSDSILLLSIVLSFILLLLFFKLHYSTPTPPSLDFPAFAAWSSGQS
jgi:hypothetical protein